MLKGKMSCAVNIKVNSGRVVGVGETRSTHFHGGKQRMRKKKGLGRSTLILSEWTFLSFFKTKPQNLVGSGSI